MTRWHAASCRSPKVELSDDKWPFCTSCDQKCPSLEELVALDQSNGDSSVLTLPPDETQGQMNLYWPSCVRYIRPESESTEDISEVQQYRKASQETVASADHATHIYDTTLDGDQLRIACLSTPPSDDYPVHVSLETYSLDNHPEYETVSYLWGGEDGDNSRCRPIFVGNYWDVLLQTRNCWSMLRYFRPRRGERLMWVDALCINQRDLNERASQVAIMGRIYESGLRVVVYLGEDIAIRTEAFPSYQTLDSFATSYLSLRNFPEPHLRFGFRDLLARKYFTRIWIVQELVLSERVVFHVGNYDFRADARTLFQVEWGQLPARWVRCIAQKSLASLPATDVYGLLRSTRRSSCSDPRDKLFGLVGLLPDTHLRHAYGPDYSISYLHFCIGLFGSWITNHTAYHLLCQAATITCIDATKPTWLPDYELPEFWPKFFSQSDTAYPYRFPIYQRGYGITHDNPKSPLTAAAESIRLLESRWLPIYTLGSSAPCKLQSVAWSEAAYVNSDTGGLTINVVHLCTFENGVRFVGMVNSSEYLFKFNSNTSIDGDVVYITSSIRLDKVICQQSDHLFMIDGENLGDRGQIGITMWDDHVRRNPPTLFLLLRNQGTKRGTTPQYKLVTAKLYLLITDCEVETKHHWKSCTRAYIAGIFDPSVDPSTKSTLALRTPQLGEFREAESLNWNSLSIHHGLEATESVGCAILSVKARTTPILDPSLNFDSDSDDDDTEDFPDREQPLKLRRFAADLSIQCVWQQIFPSLERRKTLRSTLLALCRVRLFADDPYLETQRIILQANQDVDACVTADHLVFTFGAGLCTKQSIYRPPKIGRATLELYQSSWETCKLSPGDRRFRSRQLGRDYTHLQLYCALDWEIREAGKEWRHISKVHSYDDNDADAGGGDPAGEHDNNDDVSACKHAAHGFEVRVPYEQVLAVIQEVIDDICPPLKAIMQAYEPQLSIEEAWGLAMKGATMEQWSKGTVKYFGGVKMDGSTVQVEIL